MFGDAVDHGVAAGRFSLEDWVVERQLNRISNGKISIHLEPKAMEVLLCLACHAGDVVSRRDLVDTVWAAEFISDSTLTHTIADLRKALADDARAPRFIETIPKRGYRLVAELKGDGPAGRSFDRQTSSGSQPLAVIVGERVRLGDRIASHYGDHFLFLGDQEIPLLGPAISFGRGQEADIQILAPEVSRLHARLEIDLDKVAIEDLGSKNGTLNNDEPIMSRVELSSGDTIGIGPTTLVYRSLVNDPTRTQADN